MQPKPKSNQKHKATKPGKAGDEMLKARSQMLHEVHKAAAKGKVHDEGWEMQDHPEEEKAETEAEELSEHDQYAHGGAVHGHDGACMHCGGTGYAQGGGVKGAPHGGPMGGHIGYDEGGMAEGGKWIKGAIKHPGALHKELGVPQGQKIPAKKLQKASHAGGKLGKRARLAETMKGFKK